MKKKAFCFSWFLMVSVLLFSCSEEEVAEPEPDFTPGVEILSPFNNQYFQEGDSIPFLAEAEYRKLRISGGMV